MRYISNNSETRIITFSGNKTFLSILFGKQITVSQHSRTRIAHTQTHPSTRPYDMPSACRGTVSLPTTYHPSFLMPVGWPLCRFHSLGLLMCFGWLPCGALSLRCLFFDLFCWCCFLNSIVNCGSLHCGYNSALKSWSACSIWWHDGAWSVPLSTSHSYTLLSELHLHLSTSLLSFTPPLLPILAPAFRHSGAIAGVRHSNHCVHVCVRACAHTRAWRNSCSHRSAIQVILDDIALLVSRKRRNNVVCGNTKRPVELQRVRIDHMVEPTGHVDRAFVYIERLAIRLQACMRTTSGPQITSLSVLLGACHGKSSRISWISASCRWDFESHTSVLPVFGAFRQYCPVFRKRDS